jgi:hypothetical protein
MYEATYARVCATLGLHHDQALDPGTLEDFHQITDRGIKDRCQSIAGMSLASVITSATRSVSRQAQ